MDLVKKLMAQRAYFETGITRSLDFRNSQLLKLKEIVSRYENEIYSALYIDLGKSKEECWITENGFFLTELNMAIRNLGKWSSPKKVRTNLVNLPSSSYIIPEPLGVCLIISPWNYPFQLLFTPLVGAIAAGNCVVLKSSEFAAATSAIMKKIVDECFDEKYIFLVEGDGGTVIPAMMDNFIFDHVFYTGSTAVGKLIYQSAARNLVPVTLELGGKSPCVVEADADIKVAAKRIALPKFSNAGQMCVAPDYVLVHRSKKEALVDELIKSIDGFFNADPSSSYDYGRIINTRQFDRLISYFKDGKILHGGSNNREKLFIAPTIIDEVLLDSPIMTDEIFGPILPVITFDSMDEAVAIIRRNKNPLAFYLFTSEKRKEIEWLNAVAFGGGCINNASVHLVNHHLPFGGRGTSGLGQYHGQFSFDCFSHKKAVLKTPTWIDPSMKYPPYEGKLSLFKKILR